MGCKCRTSTAETKWWCYSLQFQTVRSFSIQFVMEWFDMLIVEVVHCFQQMSINFNEFTVMVWAMFHPCCQFLQTIFDRLLKMQRLRYRPWNIFPLKVITVHISVIPKQSWLDVKTPFTHHNIRFDVFIDRSSSNELIHRDVLAFL